MAIVIVVIPIAIGMPAVAVFVPPAMALIPAAFACFAQFMTRTIRLPAVPAVMFHGFVEFVVRLDNAPLAAAVVIRQCTRCSGEGQHAGKHGGSEHGLSENPLLSRLRSEEHTSELQSQSNLVCRLLLEKKKVPH